MCMFLMSLNAFRFNHQPYSRVGENALLVGRKLLDKNTSHFYSYDANVATDHDDHLSHALEVSVVNPFDRATPLS